METRKRVAHLIIHQHTDHTFHPIVRKSTRLIEAWGLTEDARSADLARRGLDTSLVVFR